MCWSELVGIDLEWRWKTSAATADQTATFDGAEAGEVRTVQYEQPETALLPRRPRLADYAARYPMLGSVEQFPVDLLVGEYDARCRYGDKPTHDEYLGTFGSLHPELAQRLQAVDDEIGFGCSACP